MNTVGNWNNKKPIGSDKCKSLTKISINSKLIKKSTSKLSKEKNVLHDFSPRKSDIPKNNAPQLY